MTTVLITGGAESSAVSIRRCGAQAALLVRARGLGLDRRLAGGADPDTDALLSLRAGALISARHRHSLARALRKLLLQARRLQHPLDPPVPLARREILRTRDLIEELAELLDRPDPVDARGVAQVEVLLRDGSSPVYWAARGAQLRPALQTAIAALQAPPAIVAGS